MRTSGRYLFGIIARAIVFCAAIPIVAVSSAQAQLPFYKASPAEVSGPPGSIIRQELMIGAPLGAIATRILYRSTGLSGEPIAVSSVVIAPVGPVPPGGRPVVAWAHPTTGVVPHCAPSLALTFFQSVQGLHQMIERGYVVVATDYPGLGTAGPHPYLVGESEGRAVIDSVRAARELPVGAGDRFAVWGHSQGGHAALYTGLLARRYAPELQLVGVATAAPATDLGTLMRDDFNTAGGKNLTAMTLWSWARVFNAPMEKVVLPQAIPAVNRLAEECIESIFDILDRGMTGRPLDREFLSVDDLTKVQPWRGIMIRNTPGPLRREIPLFMSQGTADNVVRPAVTLAYVKRQCIAGNAVQVIMEPGKGHAFIARDTATAAVQWMADRFAGLPPPNDCAQ